jgi:hypothetical protein
MEVEYEASATGSVLYMITKWLRVGRRTSGDVVHKYPMTP